MNAFYARFRKSLFCGLRCGLVWCGFDGLDMVWIWVDLGLRDGALGLGHGALRIGECRRNVLLWCI